MKENEDNGINRKTRRKMQDNKGKYEIKRKNNEN